MNSGQRQLVSTSQEARSGPDPRPAPFHDHRTRKTLDQAARWLETATASAVAERWDDVVAESARCLRQDARCLPALELRAKALWRLGRYRELTGVTRSMIRINPHEPGYRLLQALAQLGAGRFECAADLLGNLAERSPDAEIRQIAADNLRLLQIHEAALLERLGADCVAATPAPWAMAGNAGFGWSQAALPSSGEGWGLPGRRN